MRVRLQAHSERRAEAISPELDAQNVHFLLRHQHEHYLALATSHIVVNTNATGTGKTLASLLHLTRPDMAAPSAGTLVIAPTNELARQHCDDIRDFTRSCALPHLSVHLQASVVTALHQATEEPERRGQTLHNLLRNPRDPRIARHLDLGDTLDERRPLVVVTNPDIFYYALQGSYSALDRRNLQLHLLGKFRYIVVDEFHYYTPKQVAAFFLYIAFLRTLGFFETGRMTFLTATPDPKVDQFFDTLGRHGLRVTRICPENVTDQEPHAERAIAPVDVEFVPSDRWLAPVVGARVGEIRAKLASGRDVAVISTSLADILRAGRSFQPHEYETLTGAVSEKHRRTATRSPLILATPTVDIGYNFPREGKERQGLDDLYFTARFAEEFWQRVGRVGRVVRKKVQSELSTAVCVVDPATFERLEALGVNGQAFEREQFADLLSRHGVFDTRQHFWGYVAGEGLFEAANALLHFHATLTVERRRVVEAIYEDVKTIFAVERAPAWRVVQARVRRFRALEQEASRTRTHELEYAAPLLREYGADVTKRRLHGAQGEPTQDAVDAQARAVPDARLDEVRARLRRDARERTQYVSYIRREYEALRGIFSFRDAYSGVEAVAFDPHGLVHPAQRVVRYGLEFLVRSCDIRVFPDRQRFLDRLGDAARDCGGRALDADDAAVFLEILGMREPCDQLRLEFLLEVPSIEVFDRHDLNCVRAYTGLQLRAMIGGAREAPAVYPLAPDIVRSISKRYVPALVLSDDVAARVLPRARRAGFPTRRFRIADSSSERVFASFVGTSAYYFSRWAATLGAKVRAVVERYEEFHYC